MHVGIIGGGMMGISTAFFLARRGLRITVLEKEEAVGGLCRSAEIMPGVRWDRYYHVILSTDTELLRFIDAIGLRPQVRFTETRTGFFIDGRLHSMSSTLEFLRFKPLGLIDKLRLGAGILYASRITEWRRLEKIYVKSWLVRVFGRRNYEKMWDPLLRAKLGPAAYQFSAAYIWATIKRYYGTRHAGSKKELMGCVHGGYHQILTRAGERLRQMGGDIQTSADVERMEALANGRLRVCCRNGRCLDFDRVVATVPNPELVRMWPDAPDAFKTLLAKVRYLGLVCVTLVLKRSLTPFYVTNLTDTELPFTGLIEATHVIPPDVFNGHALVYLPKYMVSGDARFDDPDEDVLGRFIGALRGMFPDLKPDDILSRSVHREPFVQPIMDLGYSTKIPPMATPLKHLFMVNTTMILDSNLNNNAAIQLAHRAAEQVVASCRGPTD